jgi:hypothetical protein
LVLPQARTKSGVGQSTKDLTEHPWAGSDDGNAITKKLIAEIAQAEPQQQEGSQKRPSLRN